ncbi:adenosylcobinamide-GDP ribazoletransferase [Tessaracoccus antarcticus]|uniref:Adenosylcobinamide-GDP ribazoletransferase n=2 Tax=Tessaracoccus antarcticus TaxID=2479848 RepID=A0A3M0GD53_9ACTN|nr:adenosylcobinamide-GDP ribazoletransferase [Tessaracoccus antarcticus]
MPSVATIDRRLAGRAMAWFPVVGLVLGLLAGGVAWGVGALGGPLLGAVLGLATLAALTGALHLDGVADTADGLGSRAPAARALEIMRRSDIGPMGVVTLLFVLLADVAAISRIMTTASLVAGPVALALAVVAGRVAVLSSTTSANGGARTEGFGALFHGVTSTAMAVGGCVAALAVAVAAGWGVAGAGGATVFFVAGALALVVGWVWRRYLARRLGGLTGDTFGSIIEVTQVVFLVTAAVGFGVVSIF